MELIDKAATLELFDAFIAEYPAGLLAKAGDRTETITTAELGAFVVGVASSLKLFVANAPAVPQPMSAVEYARERARMWLAQDALFCQNCPFDSRSEEEFGGICVKFEREYPEESVAIVQKWAAENKA